MSFKDRRRQENIPDVKLPYYDNIADTPTPKELPTYKKLILKKNSKKAVQKLVREEKQTQPAKKVLPMEKAIVTREDYKLALIGTTDTATTFRSVVKKKRLTITEVLEEILTKYINENKQLAK